MEKDLVGEETRMRKFYIQYYSDFANTYNLCYTDSREEDAQAIACGMERISRKEAENKCKDEKLRRMYSPSFAYNADSVILPFG